VILSSDNRGLRAPGFFGYNSPVPKVGTKETEMTIKHTVTLDGHVFKRTSANRTYTFAVLYTTNIERELAKTAKEAAASWDRNLDYTKEQAAGTDIGKYPDYMIGPNGPYGYNPYLDREACRREHDERARKQQQGAIAELAAGKDAFVAEAVARKRKYLRKLPRAANGTDYITVAGWTSRADLADKLANSRRAGWGLAEKVFVLPTTQEVK